MPRCTWGCSKHLETKWIPSFGQAEEVLCWRSTTNWWHLLRHTAHWLPGWYETRRQYCQTLFELFCVFREHTWADMDLGLSHLEVWSCVSTLLIRAGNGVLPFGINNLNISSFLWYVGHRRWDIIKPFFLLQSHNGEITNTRFIPLTKVS